jgi:uncharacterized membrane protein YcaP (DUF421 family)
MRRCQLRLRRSSCRAYNNDSDESRAANAHTLFEIALRTGVICCLVLIGIRISGKREVGQMTPFDLTLLLPLSNSVQNAMTGPDPSRVGGSVAATALLILNYLVAEGVRRESSFPTVYSGTTQSARS